MKYQRLFLLCCIFIAAFLPQSSHACTTFCLDTHDELVVGKNVDWWTKGGLIIVNKRNVSKTAIHPPDGTWGEPVSWTSKYGSITFNYLGREFAFDGMNEAGLVVSTMGLSLTEYPAPDARPVIPAIQWVQYQLDTAATVADVIANDAELRISEQATFFYHFFICDSLGNCASVEFLDGRMVVHQTAQETMPVKVLTNGTYSTDLDCWENEEILVPDMSSSARSCTAADSSAQRFCTAAEMLEDYDPETSGPATDYTFTVLSNLTMVTPNQWSTAYDVQHRRISFHTPTNRDIRYFDMSSFDFSCNTPVKVLDIQADLSGNVAGDFIDYTYELNRTVIGKAYAPYHTPDEVLDIYAHYPETTECVGACTLDVEHKKIQYTKLSKPRKVVLKITGDEDFDMDSQIDLGSLTLKKKSFNRKKNSLKVEAIVPAGLRPGTVPIWVGNCFGEIEVVP